MKKIKNNTRLITVLFLVGLNGCATVTKNPLSIAYNIKNGFYESLSIDEWRTSDPVCVTLEPLKPNYGEKWVPKIGIMYRTHDFKNVFHIELVDINRKDFQLNTRSKVNGNDFVTNTLDREIKWDRKLKTRLSMSESGILNFQFEGTTREIAIGFIPEKISFTASSMKANISYTVDECM